MCSKVYLGINVEPASYKRVPVESIDLQDKISQLREVAAEKTNLPSSSLELIFCGNALENNTTLEASGIRPGVTIHVLKKKEKEPPRKAGPITEGDILQLVSAFKNAVKHPNYTSVLQRLSRPEVIENILVATPGLADDPIALSFIQDSELLGTLCDPSTVRRVVEAHPTLAEAATYIVAVLHEEAASAALGTAAGTSTGYSYSLDALSDDEEMDSSQSSDSPRPNRSGDSYSSRITTAHLAAALASATGASNSVSPSPSSSSVGSNPFVTTEMFNQALQQVFGGAVPSTPGSGASRSASNGSDLSGLEALTRRQRQLQQMHEMGLTDDAVNLQALQATDWNVQEAINLVFSGAIGDADMDGDDEE